MSCYGPVEKIQKRSDLISEKVQKQCLQHEAKEQNESEGQGWNESIFDLSFFAHQVDDDITVNYSDR